MVSVDLIRDIFTNKIDYKIKVKSLESLPDNKVKVYMCKTLTLRPLSFGEYENTLYQVEHASNNDWVILLPDQGGNAFNGDYIIAPKPLFLHGSPNSVNSEYLSISSDTRDKTPFAWLLRGLRETKPFRKDSVIEVTCTGRIFLMDEADSGSWTNDSHDYYAVNPMYNLALEFIETINKYSMTNFSGDSTILDRARFGVNVENKGSTKKIISDDLSGVELDFSIDVYKHGCNC